MYKFKPIDMASWPMAQAFHYYTQMAPTTYTITVDVDVTTLRKSLKARNLKFFPAYLYLVTTAIKAHQPMRIALQEGVLGCWDCLVPVYPVFHEDSQSTSLLWTEYCEDFKNFYRQYLNDKAQYEKCLGILTAKGIPPQNAYIISCIPWFTFNSFSLHNHGIKDYFVPSFEAARLKEGEGGRIIMPLSITVHHATIEGYHLKLFLDTLQSLINAPEIWL